MNKFKCGDHIKIITKKYNDGITGYGSLGKITDVHYTGNQLNWCIVRCYKLTGKEAGTRRTFDYTFYNGDFELINKNQTHLPDYL